MADEQPNINSPNELRDWLENKPTDWARAIGVRAALRVLPLIGEFWSIDRLAVRRRQDALFSGFRTAFTSWAECKYADYHLDSAAQSAAHDPISSVGSAARLPGYPADTIDPADVARAANAVRAAGAASDDSAGGAVHYAARAAPSSAAVAELFRSVSDDARWLIEEDSGKLIDQPLWLSDVRGDPTFKANLPDWAREPLDQMADNTDLREAGFAHWIAWYRAIIPNRRDGVPGSHFGEAVDVALATQRDEFWRRDSVNVNRDIAAWISGDVPVGQWQGQSPATPPVSRRDRVMDAAKRAAEREFREVEKKALAVQLEASGAGRSGSATHLRLLSETCQDGLASIAGVAKSKIVELDAPNATTYGEPFGELLQQYIPQLIKTFGNHGGHAPAFGRTSDNEQAELKRKLAESRISIIDEFELELSKSDGGAPTAQLEAPEVPIPEVNASTRKRDFFLSFANADRNTAERIDRIVCSVGFGTFSQLNDMPIGSNFVEEMNKGLAGTGRLIALYSPAYEASKHCQAEWNAAYNADPDGTARKIVGFLIRETNLSPLARQVVYKSLIGLNGLAFEKAVIETVRAAVLAAPPPATGAKSPFAYGWSPTGTIAVAGGGMEQVVVPPNRSQDDPSHRLQAAVQIAGDLAIDCSRGTYQVRSDYAASLNRYAERLPIDRLGNIYLADCEARVLRAMLERDFSIGINDAFAARLKVLLEQHQGLRPYFPQLMTFYEDVRKGKLTEPLPLDSIEQLEKILRENTPEVFEPEVSESLNSMGEGGVESVDGDALAGDQEPEEDGVKLPPDPIIDIDPERAAQQAKGGAFNKIWEMLLQVEAGARNIERIEKVTKVYAKYVRPLVEWLSNLPD